MLISITFLKKALKDRKRAKIEGYSRLESANAGISLGFATGFLVIAVIFVMLEFLVLFYNIQIAIQCTQGGAERVVHLVLATMFTLPYALFNVFFSQCAKQNLINN